MGSTSIRFRGQAFEASDDTLEVWLALLVREINKLDNIPAWLREVRDEWELQSTAGFGFGVMPGLDRFITDDEQRDVILGLSRQALKKLEGYDQVIPHEALNALKTGGEAAPYTQDVPVWRFLRPARYFAKLIEGSLPPSEKDARVGPDSGQ